MQNIALKLLGIITITGICNKIVKETGTMGVSVPLCSIQFNTAQLKIDFTAELVVPLRNIWNVK